MTDCIAVHPCLNRILFFHTAACLLQVFMALTIMAAVWVSNILDTLVYRFSIKIHDMYMHDYYYCHLQR